MDWSLVSFYQGTDDNSDPSYAVIQVYYQSLAICYETYMLVPIELSQESEGFLALAQSIAESVIACCGPTIPNPSYDPNLTSCWGE